MARNISDDAELIIDKEFMVHNKGFVRLVDYMGNDERIVQSARVSYGQGTKSYREDSALIDYLLRNGHTSPFEQVVLTFHCKMPVFVARQWVRHRMARINEISGRYSMMDNEFYLPGLDDITYQSTNNKQGRGEAFSGGDAELIQWELEEAQQKAYKQYQELIDKGVAKELARINLPASLYTQWYWQIDLNNLFHFLKLRLDPHAQQEIRDYAKILLMLAEKVAPLAVTSFRVHMLGGEHLTAKELAIIAKHLNIDSLNLESKELKQLREKLNKK